MTRARTCIFAFSVCVLALTVAGCTRTLDTDAIEDEIMSGIEEQTEATVDSVDCPDDVKAEEGNTFECSADTDDGTTLTIEVTQADDEGNVQWQVTGAE